MAADFNTVAAQIPGFADADPATQEEYRIAHQQLLEEAELNNPNNPSNLQAAQNQAEADNSGFWRNTAVKAGESQLDLFNRRHFANDIIPDGKFDDSMGRDLSLLNQKRNEQIETAQLKQLYGSVNKLQKVMDTGDTWDKIKAWGTFATELPENIPGMIQLGAESSSSMTAIIGGAKAGAVLGPWGAAGGAFAAETADAASHKLIELTNTAMAEQGYAVTPANYAMFIKNNPGFAKEAQEKALKYGAVLGFVDLLTGGLASKIATLPTRAARKLAMHSIDDATRVALKEVAAAKNVSVTKLLDSEIERRAIGIYNNRSFKQKLGQGSLSLGGEILSEPVSEAAATAAIGEENTTENLVLETLGGVGAGPIGAAVNTSIFGSKAGSKKAAEFAKKLLTDTPESKAAIQEQKAAVKTAKAQSQAVTEAKFKDKVAATAVDDASVDEMIDPSNKEKYNPVKAVAILAKSTDVNASEKAETVYANMHDDVLAVAAKVEEHKKKANDKGEFSPQDKELGKALMDELTYKSDALMQTYQHIEAIRNKRADEANKKTATPIDPATATSEDVVDNITKTFGSSGKITVEQRSTLLAGATLNPETRAVLEADAVAETAKAAVVSLQSKSTEEVANDIYNGQRGSKFKGIEGYKKAISDYLDPAVNNVDGANAQLIGLKKFRDDHQAKANEFQQAYDTAVKKGLPYGAGIKVMHNGKSYEIHKGSGKIVAPIQAEAKALAAEVKLAESLFAAQSAVVTSKGSSTLQTSTTSTTSTTAEPAAPKVEEAKPTQDQLKANTQPTTTTSDVPLPPESPVPGDQNNDAPPWEDVPPPLEDDAAVTKNKEAISTKESTVTENADNVTNEDLVDIEYNDVGEIPIEFTNARGEVVTKPYNEAISEIEAELAECESVLNCINS